MLVYMNVKVVYRESLRGILGKVIRGLLFHPQGGITYSKGWLIVYPLIS